MDGFKAQLQLASFCNPTEKRRDNLLERGGGGGFELVLERLPLARTATPAARCLPACWCQQRPRGLRRRSFPLKWVVFTPRPVLSLAESQKETDASCFFEVINQLIQARCDARKRKADDAESSRCILSASVRSSATTT